MMIYLKDESAWIEFFKEARIEEEYVSKYAKDFVTNKITFDILKDLNETYLKEMGITIVGHSINILNHAKEVASKYFPLSYCYNEGGAALRMISFRFLIKGLCNFIRYEKWKCKTYKR